MKNRPIVYLFLTVALAALLAAPVMAQQAMKCYSDFPGYIVAQPLPPCDIHQHGGVYGNNELARFAWNSFISLTWPAQDPTQFPYQHGVPVGNTYGPTTPTVVWDSWREKRELYQIRKTGSNTYAYVAPPTWDTGLPQTNPNPQLAMCPGEDDPDPAKPFRIFQSSKTDNFADETDEIGLALLWRATSKFPNEQTILRYQVKFNFDYYTFVRGLNFWQTKVPTPVNLPQGDNGTTTTGSILVKTAWMMLGGNDDASQYYTVPALYYKDNNGTSCYAQANFGLIAIHVIRKTKAFPYLFFSTFGHINNLPNKFYYANTVTTAKGSNVPNSILPNPFGVTYTNPSSPQAGYPSDLSQYTAKLLNKELTGVLAANVEAQRFTKGTVWANYQLIGVQYKPVNAPNNTATSSNPAGDTPYYQDQEYYLANPVVETNQRFQFFTGNTTAPVPTPGSFGPGNANGGNVNLAGGGAVNMGGCMGCHGVAQQLGADFSFTLLGGLGTPKAYSAETLEEKCAEIALVYSEAAQGCVSP